MQISRPAVESALQLPLADQGAHSQMPASALVASGRAASAAPPHRAGITRTRRRRETPGPSFTSSAARISVATLAMHYACVVVAASDGGSGRASRPDPGKSSSRTCVEPDTETTALAVVRDTPLSPLMGRLRQKHREFAYPEIGRTLTLDQRWDTAGVGTGAAVWDSAELLARYMATSGAARAFNPDALKDDAGSGGSSGEDPSKTKMDANAAALARDWWAGAVVVELGGGLGLASMVAASMGATVLCTDGDDLVVDMCARNVRANGLATDSIDASSSSSRGSAEAARLAWGDEEDVKAAEAWVAARRGIEPGTTGRAKAYPDVVLLADVVYGEHPDAWRGLTRTCARLAGPGTVILLSHTRRGDSGAHRKFFDWLRDAGFVVEAVERWKGTRDGFASLTLLYRAYRYGSTTLGRSYSVVK